MSKKEIINFIITNSKEHPEEWAHEYCEWVHTPTQTRVWVGNESYGLEVSRGTYPAPKLFGGVTIMSVFGLVPWRWRVWKAYLNWEANNAR